jgi:hypothetical protein
MMTYNQSLWELSMETLYPLTKGALLLRGAGIIRFPLRIIASFITDPDTVAVVVQHMSANFLKRTAKFSSAIPTDYQMVANALPSPLFVPAVDVSGRTLLVRTNRRAMNHD